MTSLTPDPLTVAMLTVSMTLPLFALLMPAGVMADRLDRRRILIVSQGLMALVAFALAIATWLGHATPAVLLIASAGLGVGTALSAPAWNSLVPELVPRSETAEAVMLNSVAFNIARALGPALGGVILATHGPADAFLFNAVSFLGVIEVLRRYDEVKRASHVVKRKHEPLREAMTAAFVHLKCSRKMRAMHISVSVFGLTAASVPALLPVFARERLHADGAGYGLLLGAIGIGAVIAAVFMKRVRQTLPARVLVASSMAVYGAAVLAMSTTRLLPVAIVLLLPAGMAWVTTFSTLNALVQLSAPFHLKSRALALYQLSFYSAWTAGAFMGGVIAKHAGVSLTIGGAAAACLGAAALAARMRIPSYGQDPRDPPNSSHEVLVTPAPISVR